MDKKIITIAAVVFALIFVILLALFMSTIITKGNSTNNQLVDTLQTTVNTSISSYDNATMKGESVISAIRNVKSIGDTKLRLEIDVFTLKSVNCSGVSGQAYGFIGNSSNTFESFKQKESTDAYYINPDSDFNSYIVYNTNDVPIGIVFMQVGLWTPDEDDLHPADNHLPCYEWPASECIITPDTYIQPRNSGWGGGAVEK